MTTLERALERLGREVEYMEGRLRWGEDEHGGKSVDAGLVWLAGEVRQEYTDVGFYTRETQEWMLPRQGKPWRIYVAGPYSHDDPLARDQNIEAARNAVYILLRAGHYPFCPHTMTSHFEEDHPDVGYERYVELYLHYLRVMQGCFLLAGWQESNGTLVEVEMCDKWHIPIWQALNEVPLVDGFPAAVDIVPREETNA